MVSNVSLFVGGNGRRDIKEGIECIWVFFFFFMSVGERMKWLRSNQEQENKRKLLQVPREEKIKCYFSHQNSVVLPKKGEV